ncbi:MAG TPA: hypothetical protein DCO83_17795 [Mucilaginibacter sp.]|jgi:uncharacterized protein (TIGR02145 family)|nr:hypothetical protein [Mucilaginibacter sp.]
MKKLLFPLFIITVIFTACSKKSNVVAPTNMVYINGNDYSTVVIGNQTWTSVNYNGAGGVNYNNQATNNPADGKLYTLAEVNAIPLTGNWRLPTEDDYNNLLSSIGVPEPAKGSNSSTEASGAPVYALMSKTSWTKGGGTNTSGFNATGVGYYHSGIYDSAGITTVFFTSSNYNGTPLSFAVQQANTVYNAYISNLVVSSTDRASVRFVKDN